MNMGDDSKLVYDEVGERLTAVASEAVDYFPFGDKLNERIAELEEALRPFAALYHVNNMAEHDEDFVRLAAAREWFKAAAEALTPHD